MSEIDGVAGAAAPALKRSVTLPLAVLTGLGVTVGAGIYVLIGAAALRAGPYAPTAFLIAAALMGLTACSLAELTSRMPVAAGEAAFVRHGLRSERIALLVGLMVVVAGVVSAAAIAKGAAGYVAVFIPLPHALLVPAIVLAMGAVAAWGIVESTLVAALMTVIEVAGLVVVIAVGLAADPGQLARLPEALPPLGSLEAWSATLGAALLAVFAFIGFEGLVNIAEEVHEPERTLPRAILITLGLTTVLYVLVLWVALSAVPRAELGASAAPLSLVFSRVTGASATVISLVAVFATVNGIIAQMVMSSRVIYGLAEHGDLPEGLSAINRRTRTPLVATMLVVAVVLVLAVAFPIDRLADLTSRVMLVVFALVNGALWMIKVRREPGPPRTFAVPTWVPIAGALTCAGLLLADAIRLVAG